ncbi:unnamed protein product [Cochlearia groenlandica]
MQMEWVRLTKRGRFQVIRDKQTGPTKGYQYDREDAKESIQSQLDKKKKCGIVICIAHTQKKRNGSVRFSE